MGYSIRTENHRYTRWIDWNSKEVQAEELYDYTSVSSVQHESAFLVERHNIIDLPVYLDLREQLRSSLERTLARRVEPVVLKAPGKKVKKSNKS
jgi:hypothetical protein